MKTSLLTLMKRPRIAFLVLLVLIVFLTAPGCEDGEPGAGQTATSAADDAADRAALLAAQTLLLNAQSAQEAYFAANGTYAATAEQLNSPDRRLRTEVKFISGDAKGYEMQVQANDAGGTILIIRKSGVRVERVDGGGERW